MSLPTDLLNSLKCPNTKELIKRQLSPVRKHKRAIFYTWRNEVSPADLYCYLFARFGPPNGVQNILRKDDSDNLIHWEWVLDHPQGKLSFTGLNFRTEVLVTADWDRDESESKQLVNCIKTDFSAWGRQMSEVRKHLEDWMEFVNPYQRLRNSVDNLLQELKMLGLTPEEKGPSEGTTFGEFSEEKWNELATKYSKGLGLCFGIRSMLPVLAEAYVNFLLFVLLRPEIKADDRLRENIIRQPIDVRIKSLHLNCIGFSKQVDYSAPQCKSYHTLVNERNDLLHGNVVLEKLKFNEVYFHGRVPVFMEYRSMWERSVGVGMNAVGLNKIDEELKVVNDFIEHLSTYLLGDVKKQIDIMSEKRNLGWNKKTTRIGVLFPDHLVDIRMKVEGV
jgi:hypothetical protein